MYDQSQQFVTGLEKAVDVNISGAGTINTNAWSIPANMQTLTPTFKHHKI